MTRKTMTILLLCTLVFGGIPVYATDPAPIVYVDGKKLDFLVEPMITKGTTLVPIRKIFEAQGAEVSWDGKTQTMTARKDDLTFTYAMGEHTFNKNDEIVTLPVPGKMLKGTILFPLRGASETMGNRVGWDGATHTIRITTHTAYDTTVEWGVNLRSAPGAEEVDSRIYRMIPSGEKIHVMQEINAFWLQVETTDHTIGYISAKPKYTDYTSGQLVGQQADELITYAETFMATPYKFGASPGQTETFDCSSFTKHIFEEVLHIELPRTSYQQAEVGQEIEVDELRKGDLMFFTARGLPIGHVGIYAGNGKILQTYSEDYGVRYDDFDEQWVRRFVSARRLF